MPFSIWLLSGESRLLKNRRFWGPTVLSDIALRYYSPRRIFALELDNDIKGIGERDVMSHLNCQKNLT